ncbi:glycine cleavage system H protein, mitochondrial-like [Phragmites australis]|uniref:glycine cleavage system H protein, mitochondrial-like n=1 Tax=Phragmites australis TaxID=29695 RepID=UPI002D77BC06|nr:glycine cleavage system H protein, mitochondrial-like [Phragmites australis]
MALRLWASSAANALKISGTGARAAAPALSISRYFSTVLDGLKYTSSHEWVKDEGGMTTVGITDHAQGHLGEVVFVELPEPGTNVTQGGSFGNVESVKATSDVNSPISGEVVEVNSKLSETPGLINSSPYEDGWMIKVKPSSPAEVDGLLDAAKYTKHCEEEDAH